MSKHLHEMVDPNTIKNVSQLIAAAGEGIKVASGNASSLNGKYSRDSYSYSSAAKAASKLIAVYPILISRSVSSGTAQMISKYIEQKGCIIIQLALQMMNISNAENGAEYLRKFHQNLNIGGDDIAALGSIINAMIGDISDIRNNRTDFQHNSATLANNLAKEKILESIDWDSILENDNSINISNQQMKELMEMFSDAEKYQIYDTQLNERSINDFIVKESFDNYKVTFKSFTEMDINDINNENDNKTRHSSATILKDQDIKKMNSAVPSLIVVKFYNSSTASVATEFIIGIKSKVLGINADEILRRIANDNRDGKSFLNLMRTITGELKMTDFLLGLSRTKEDLKSTRVKGAYGDIWNLLQNRAAAAKTAIARGQRNDFSAITTVVISREDADDLFKEENLDITDPTVAKHFMESYNLLGFAITDDSVESVKFMFDDGNRYFEEFSYKMLAKETETETYKSMLKLMANNR